MEFPLLSNLEREVALPWASPLKKLLVFHLQFHDPSSADTVPTEKKIGAPYLQLQHIESG